MKASRDLLKIRRHLAKVPQAPSQEQQWINQFVMVLTEIASYDAITPHGKPGICPYGCDCPNIAAEALARYRASKNK